MLDALRGTKSGSRARGTAPRRGGHAHSVLSSLGYTSESAGGGGGRNNFRLALVAVLIGLVGVLAWQGVTKYNLLGMLTGGSNGSSLAELVRNEPATPPAGAKRDIPPSNPANTSAAPADPSTMTQPTAPATPEGPAPKVATEAVVKDAASVEPDKPAEPSVEVDEAEPKRVVVAKPRPRRGVETVRATRPLSDVEVSDEPAFVVPRGAAANVAPVFKPAGTADEHFKSALYYHRIGDFENALVKYRAVLAVDEMNAEAHNNLGLLYQDKGLMPEAIERFKRATAIDANYTKAHNNLGVALLRTGQVDAAAQEFRWLLSREPRNVEAMTNLAAALKQAGRMEEAREQLQRALTINARNATAHYNLALVFEETGDVLKAIEHYESFLTFGGGEQATMAADVRRRVVDLRASLQRLSQ
jgi:Tfp pilus assembly protein PilF